MLFIVTVLPYMSSLLTEKLCSVFIIKHHIAASIMQILKFFVCVMLMLLFMVRTMEYAVIHLDQL